MENTIYSHGLKEGTEIGMKLGTKQEKTKIAKKMEEKGTNIEFIMEVTGLEKEEIAKL